MPSIIATIGVTTQTLPPGATPGDYQFTLVYPGGGGEAFKTPNLTFTTLPLSAGVHTMSCQRLNAATGLPMGVAVSGTITVPAPSVQAPMPASITLMLG